MLKAFFGTLALLGVALAVFGVYFIWYGIEARGWPSVQGQIVATMVRSHTLGTVPRGLPADQRERARTYYPEVTYRWSVGGQTFTGSRYALGESQEDFSERADAERAAARYPAGQAIEVFYDPADPSSAVIDRSSQSGTFVPLPLGLLMLAMGAGGLLKLPQLRAAMEQE